MYHICRHIKTDGNRCGSPAIQNTNFCYFHTSARRKAKESPDVWANAVTIPVLEDRSAIQIALSQVLNALGSSRLDARQASVLLAGLKLASLNLERGFGILGSGAVRSLTSTEDGDELAPEKHACEAKDDCNTCPCVDTCELCEFEEDEDEEE